MLALFAPFAGNTPTEYLLIGSSYEANTLAVFDGRDYDIAALRDSADVVFNLVSDADQAQEVLPLVTGLVDRIGLPTINPPRKIQQTSREIVARLLGGIPGCLIPKVLRLGADVSSITALEAAATFAMPVLVRPAGTHGGDDFEKFDNLSRGRQTSSPAAGADHYMIESPRLPLGRRSLPQVSLHLPRRRDPALPSGDRAELEAASRLHRHDRSRLDAAGGRELPQGTRRHISRRSTSGRCARSAGRIDLEYFGIDCGLDAAGNLVVFEVNASMLVHQHNEKFP